MIRNRLLIAALLVPACLAPLAARAEDGVRTYEENGVTYQETKRTVHWPVCETKIVDQQQTVYAEQYKTVIQPMQRSYQTPVTEFVWEPYWANRWNPFVQPTVAYRYVPRVRWVTHTDQVQMPVVQREVVPHTQTVKVPVTTQKFVDEEQTSRIAISGKPTDPFAQGNSAVARQNPAVGTPTRQ